MVTQTPLVECEPNRPVRRRGIAARALTNGMVYLRHPNFPSQIINLTQWNFLEMCDGSSLEELKELAPARLGFEVTIEQLRSTVEYLAELGVLEGSTSTSNHYRLVDASPLIARLAPLVRTLTTQWFACFTLFALVAAIGLLVTDWGRFTDEVAQAARRHPVASIMLYYLTFIPIALLHELGHAVVINYYGGEVPEIVIRRNGHFAVLSNASVLKKREQSLWYLSMGTVVDVYIWLALLIAFHYTSHYLLLMCLLPQTVYFLLYSYSIFNNSDFLKIVATWFDQPLPTSPWEFLRNGWRKHPESKPARQLLYVMTASLAVKLALTGFLIWSFLAKEYRVLILYFVYRALIYAIGHWQQWVSRFKRRRLKEMTKVALSG
ncbi:hypothetical protein BH18ACI4_BH18ACI4_24420 [soil metagenome]